MAPEGSCPRAIDTPVASTSSSLSSVRAPRPRSPSLTRLGFHGVHHQALADQRIESLFGQPCDGRLAHDVPDQHPVVGAGHRVLVVVHADRALQPPVGGVQAVRVMVPADPQPGPGQLGLQFDLRVYPHVSAGNLVILGGQRPADPFRQEGRHSDRGQSARPKHPCELGHGPLVVQYVLQDLGRDHPVERPVAERHRPSVPRDRCRSGFRVGLARLPHRPEHAPDTGELIGIEVKRHHIRATPVHLERMPPAPAPQVQHPLPRPDRKPPEVHGQHDAPAPACPAIPAASRSLIASRYAATVARATAGQANRSPTRRSARSASAARSAGSSCSRRSTAASSSLSAGVTRTAASPVTSGSAPQRLATSGVPDAMCSTAGSENPSYSEGTTAIAALASRAEKASSSSPWVNVTRSARDSWAANRLVAAAGRPTTTRCTSRSVATLPTACSSVGKPLRAESALATAMIRPGTRSVPRGRNLRVSTPSGTIRTRSVGTPKSRQMSFWAEADTVISGPALATRRATRACIRTKPYQRRRDSRSSPRSEARSICRSTVIGWWMLVTSGSPSRPRPSMP